MCIFLRVKLVQSGMLQAPLMILDDAGITIRAKT